MIRLADQEIQITLQHESPTHAGFVCSEKSCVGPVQLAEQSVESFMDRRGFRALPEHEQVWAVPVSKAPAAYNLRGHLADPTGQEEEQLTDNAGNGHSAYLTQDKAAKAKQKVRHPGSFSFSCQAGATGISVLSLTVL